MLIPAPFEFTGDQAVVRIDRVVLSFRAGHFVARLLECEFDLPKFLASLGLLRGQGAQRGPNAERLQRRITSAPTARSMRIPPNEMHRSPPWFRCPPRQW